MSAVTNSTKKIAFVQIISTVLISGTEDGFDGQGDGEDGRSRTLQGEALEANDEDYPDGTILFPTIVSYSTLMVWCHHLFQVQRPNLRLTKISPRVYGYPNLLPVHDPFRDD